MSHPAPPSLVSTSTARTTHATLEHLGGARNSQVRSHVPTCSSPGKRHLPSLAASSDGTSLTTVIDKGNSLPAALQSGLGGSQAVLQSMTSRSPDLPVINRLPMELIIAILDFVFDDNGPSLPAANILQRPPNQLRDVSSVCSYWREIAINTPRLWSLVDFTKAGGLDHTALLLQRASRAPLSIEINSALFKSSDPQIHIPLQLDSHMSRVQALTLEAPTDVMQSIINCWLIRDSPSLITSLQLSCPKRPSWLQHAGCRLDSTQIASDRLNQLLGSVRILRLHNVYFDWSSCTFGGLTTLELAYLSSAPFITLVQLVQILLASPALKAFYLIKVFIESNREGAGFAVNPPTVSLPFLETLEFSSLATKICPLISLLKPGPHPLELRLNLFKTSRTFEKAAIVSFLARSNVKRLRIGTFTRSCDQWFRYLPQLEILDLMGQLDIEVIFSAISPIPVDDVTQNILNCPKLHTINFRQDCRLSSADDLQRLLKSHNIRSFTVSDSFRGYPAYSEARSLGKWISIVDPSVAFSIVPDNFEYLDGFVPHYWWS